MPVDGAGAKEEPVGNLGAGEYFRKVLSYFMYTKPRSSLLYIRTPLVIGLALCELRRTPLIRTWVNRKAGQSGVPWRL